MLRFTLDVANQRLVSWQGGLTTLPDFRQGNQTVEVRLREPDLDSPNGAYKIVAPDDYLGPIVGLWYESDFTLDNSGDSVLALITQDGFTYNTDSASDPYWTGTLNTYTEEIVTRAASLGSPKTFPAYFAIGLLREDLTIEPVIDHSGGEPNAVISSITPDMSGVLPVSALPGYRAIKLPLFLKSNDGERHYILDENPQHDGVVFSIYNP